MDVIHLNRTLDRENFNRGAYDLVTHVKPDWKWEDVQFRVRLYIHAWHAFQPIISVLYHNSEF